MRVRLVIAMSVLALVVSANAYAQSFSTDIPHSFIAGEKDLPAGAYTFVKRSDNTLLIRNAQGGQVLLPVVSRVTGTAPIAESGIVFDVSDRARIISEVWIPGAGGFLVHHVSAGDSVQRLIAVPEGSAKRDGKTAFAQTCAMCHGAEGKGNPDADKFFKMTIPRLNSESVQAKSDQEIKEIITAGRRKMDPVRIEDQGARHWLATQSVDQIIAYLRTLKK